MAGSRLAVAVEAGEITGDGGEASPGPILGADAFLRRASHVQAQGRAGIAAELVSRELDTLGEQRGRQRIVMGDLGEVDGLVVEGRGALRIPDLVFDLGELGPGLGLKRDIAQGRRRPIGRLGPNAGLRSGLCRLAPTCGRGARRAAGTARIPR